MTELARHFDAVLFDMDGVLVDSERQWDEVRSAYAAAHGSPWTSEDQLAVMGANSPQWSEAIRQRLGADVPAERIAAEVVAGVVARFRSGAVAVVPGAPEAVRRIAARYPVAIASSSPREVIAAALELLGLEGVFGATVSADEVGLGKPAPDVYRLAARRLGTDAERCLVIEDSTNGVLAGRAAGAFVVLVPSEAVAPAAAAFEAADLVVAHLRDVDPDRLWGSGSPRPAA